MICALDAAPNRVLTRVPRWLAGWPRRSMNSAGSGYEDSFSLAVGTPDARGLFVNNTLEFLEHYGFDG